jgi:hypothetical protein
MNSLSTATSSLDLAAPGNRVIETSDEAASISHQVGICERTFEGLLATKCTQCADEQTTAQAFSFYGAKTKPRREPPLKCPVKRDLVEEYNRLIAWSTNSGIFAAADHSLDWRLQTLKEIRESFLLQLIIIRARLLHILRSPSFRDKQELPTPDVTFQETGGLTNVVTSSTAHVHESTVKQSSKAGDSGHKCSSPSQGDLPCRPRQDRHGQRAHNPASTTPSSGVPVDVDASAIKEATDPCAESFRHESRSMDAT